MKRAFAAGLAVLVLCGCPGALGAQLIETFAGNGTPGYTGDGGNALLASLNSPTGTAVDVSGNLYIADSAANVVRKVAANGTISTFAGTGAANFSGDNGLATLATLNGPTSVAIDSGGNVYIADNGNHRIRKVSGGTITTFAGNGTPGFAGDGAAANLATLNFPSGLAFDGPGNLYIADFANGRVRKVDTLGTITTVAGNGFAGFGGDGGPATSAKVDSPKSVAVDSAGNIFIADKNNDRIRKVNLSGIISTVAGNGTTGFGGDGGPATSASFFSPVGVAVDGPGNLYIADFNNNRIRKVDTLGIITTLSGSGVSGFGGDGLAAASGVVNGPAGVTVSGGNLFVADSGNSRVRRVLTANVQCMVPPSTTAGGPFLVSVAIKDSSNATVVSYRGTIHFTSSDPLAVLPADYTFIGSDAGIKSFNVTLKTAGNQTVTALDVSLPALTGAGSLIVNPAAANALALSGFPAKAVSGVSNSLTVTAKDTFGNTATGYFGTVTFSSSDAQAVLPANYTFVAADAGVKNFNATLKTVGVQSLTVTDVSAPAMTATQNAIQVGTLPAITSPLAVTATAGQPFSYAITASGIPAPTFGTLPLPAGLTSNNNLISGTLATVGVKNVTLFATNILGTDSKVLQITVNGTPPLITSALSASGGLGVPFSYTLTASGTTPITFTATPLPPGLVLNGATITGNPTAAGVFSVVLTAANGIGAGDTQTMTITIAAPPVNVTVTASPNPARSGDTVALSATATDPNGLPLTYKWDFGDQTLSATGQGVTHVYSASADANFTATVTVSNAGTNTMASQIIAVFAPNSGGTTIKNLADGKPGVKNPLNGIQIGIAGSEGGVIELNIDLGNVVFRSNEFDVNTDFSDLPTRGTTGIKGIRPVHKYVKSGVFVATSNATQLSTGAKGKARKTLAISRQETGEIPAATGQAASRDIAVKSLKGKFLFVKSGSDDVSLSGTVKLPAGLDLTKVQDFSVGVGNITDTTTIDPKGRAALPGTEGRIKKLRVKYPRVKGLTQGGEDARIEITLSGARLGDAGFDTEGITPDAPDIAGTKPTPRSIQVAMVLAGVSYETLAPVGYKVSRKKDTGQIQFTRGQ